MRNVQRLACLAAAVGGATLLSACTVVNTPEASSTERQDQAMRRPFDYSPMTDVPDISGGGIGEYDPKSMGRDLNHVLNP